MHHSCLFNRNEAIKIYKNKSAPAPEWKKLIRNESDNVWTDESGFLPMFLALPYYSWSFAKSIHSTLLSIYNPG